MQEQLNEIQQDVKEMKAAMLGTKYGQKGLVHRVEKVECYQQKDRKHKWMIAGGAVVVGFIVKFWDKIHW